MLEGLMQLVRFATSSVLITKFYFVMYLNIYIYMTKPYHPRALLLYGRTRHAHSDVECIRVVVIIRSENLGLNHG